MDGERVVRAVREMLAGIGEDPEREGLRETPGRVAEAYMQLFSGLREDPARQLDVTFDESARDLVIIRDLPLASMCEHHILPFAGKAHVGYLPEGKVVGFSEVAKLVDGYARRPQIQERLTAQVADALHSTLATKGALVLVEATHYCMTMRNPEATGSIAVTMAARGVFEEDVDRRAEVLALIQPPGR